MNDTAEQREAYAEIMGLDDSQRDDFVNRGYYYRGYPGVLMPTWYSPEHTDYVELLKKRRRGEPVFSWENWKNS